MASPKQTNSRRLTSFRSALLAWYKANKRDLPWRNTRDPYSIWVSEIMLQQTRVNAVLEHYRRFLELFPTTHALASAPIERVLAAWSGLGYYRRARGLHQAAQVVARERDGKIPRNIAELRHLPGIGRYTAAAIASIAFGEQIAVVDGNVERVLSRLDGVEHAGETLWQRAQEFISPHHPGDWNQAMMELGATVCTPKDPICVGCPVTKWCKQRGVGAPKQKEIRHQRELAFALVHRRQSVLLVRRPAEASLMAGMWELPEIELASASDPLFRLRHSITNTEYTVTVHSVPAAKASKTKGAWKKKDELHLLALTGLARKVFKRLEWM